MRTWLVVLAVLLAGSSPAWPQEVRDSGVAHEERTQVQKTHFTNPQAETVPVVRLGVVMALDQKEGALVLRHGDGTRSDLVASPKLLDKVRIGDPVSVVVRGSRVETVQRLGDSSLRA